MSFIKSLFSSPTKGLENFKPAGINAGGINSTFSGGNINLTSSPERLGLVSGIANKFAEQAGLFKGLRDRVAPGVSELRSARLGEVENARTAAIGNLRENLARRRVLGSSFGQDALSRAESEFGAQKERVAAESFLQEMELTDRLLNEEFQAARGQFQTGLDQLNLEAGIAAGLAGKATEQLGANARAIAALKAKEQEGAGKFFGNLAGNFFGPTVSGAGESFAGSLGF